jgi:hypothetical protein
MTIGHNFERQSSKPRKAKYDLKFHSAFQGEDLNEYTI